MTVVSGTRLGPYEIGALLGAGGMGEVYRARDTRLDRSVAVKILPDSFSQQPQFRARFEREARAISQLSHPHICVLHDVGENYLVMELLEGESLAERITRGPLPLDQVLRYGAEIASALDRAHGAGIVHRDLKPGNVMITKSGAKLLDFGLAKSAVIDTPTVDGGTVQKALTQEGTILGTFQYMAPEQLEGMEADSRTDIFAFGAMLYEMATGRRAFEGKTKTSLIAAIVKEDPRPLSEVRPLSPPALDHVISKCLAKDPNDRWQSAHDLAGELKWISEAGSQVGVAVPLLRKRKHVERAAWIAALAGAAAVAVFFATRAPAPPLRVESAIVAPEGVSFTYAAGSVALSEDGRQLAFVGQEAGGKSRLWVRSLDTNAPRVLAGTEGALNPFWSPDGKSIAFSVDNKRLRKVSVGGGTPETIAETRIDGGSWGSDGNILIGTTRGIERISAAGGTSEVIVAARNRTLGWPKFLPDGRRFLFTSVRGATTPDGLYAASLDDRTDKVVLPGVYSNAEYTPPGFIIYSRDGDLRAQRVDPETLAPAGDPVRLADRVQYDPDSKSALFAASGSGSLVYLEGEGAGKSELAWVSRDGKELGVLAPPAMYYSPRLSHDEKRIAVDLSDTQTASGDIWLIDVAQGSQTRLTHDPANESSPLWSGDDRRMFYFAEKEGRQRLFARASSGTGSDEALQRDERNQVPLDLSPDGRLLAYMVSVVGSTNTDLWVLDLSTRKSTAVVVSPFIEMSLQFSPDGNWIAYVSDESGRDEVYVQKFPDSAGKQIISRGGGSAPGWSADGRQLYYVSPERILMSVPLSLGASVEAAAPVPLFEARVRSFGRQYIVTRDGSRFLLNRTVGESGSRPMTLVQNWIPQPDRP